MSSLNLRPSRIAAGPALALALVMSPALAGGALAASPVPLGTAESFALLAGSTITNTGATTISGDIGLCCTGLATTGFGPGANQVNQPSGAQHIGTGSVAATAQDDLDIAYGNAAGQAVTNTVPVDLSLAGTPANPLLPGVYESTAHGALKINTGLTLDFQGNPNAVFIFQGTDLVTASGTDGSIRIVNGGAAPSSCNIFWQLSDATQGVTLGTGSAFRGTTMSLGASVLGTAAMVEGRILTRRSKAVNLDTNTITRSPCASIVGVTPTPAPTTPTPTPNPTPTPTPNPTPTPTPTPNPTPTATPTPTAPPATNPAAPPATNPAATPPPTGAVASLPNAVGAITSNVGLLPGNASLVGPTAPVTGPFDVSVTGTAIATVTFLVDGKRRAVVKAKRGRRRFKITIDPRRQSHRVHRVTARMTFTTASRRGMTTRRLVYRRATAGPRPRFTG